MILFKDLEVGMKIRIQDRLFTMIFKEINKSGWVRVSYTQGGRIMKSPFMRPDFTFSEYGKIINKPLVERKIKISELV